MITHDNPRNPRAMLNKPDLISGSLRHPGPRLGALARPWRSGFFWGMMAAMTLWFATGNIHKKLELEAVLAGAGAAFRLSVPAEAGMPFDPLETGKSFLENALIKAGELYRLVAPDPVIADDSGLCVDVLDGRPGVYSARYGAGGHEKLDPAERNALLLREVGDAENRKARFVCAMVLLFSPDRFYAVQETLEGEVLGEARGAGGFGYDPILYLPGLGRAAAELSVQEKNRISHRAKAGRALARFLQGL